MRLQLGWGENSPHLDGLVVMMPARSGFETWAAVLPRPVVRARQVIIQEVALLGHFFQVEADFRRPINFDGSHHLARAQIEASQTS